MNTHDQWPTLAHIADGVVGIIGDTEPITVYAFYSPRYKWVGLLRHPMQVVNAISDFEFGQTVWEWFKAPRSTVQVNGYDITDLACQMRDLLASEYRIPNPTVHVRAWMP